MRLNSFKLGLRAAVQVAAILLLGAGASFAQSSVNMTAAPWNALLPDGQAVPMWGYSCSPFPTCQPLNPLAGTGWSPVVITIPPGDLDITLSNNLPAQIPTSLTIVGTLGGGLVGGPRIDISSVDSPKHAVQGATWTIVGETSGAAFNPPSQGPRLQSFGIEVTHGTTSTLQWKGLKPGTYLIESGTHPSIQGPMGLYGVLVVTTVPAATTK